MPDLKAASEKGPVPALWCPRSQSRHPGRRLALPAQSMAAVVRGVQDARGEPRGAQDHQQKQPRQGLEAGVRAPRGQGGPGDGDSERAEAEHNLGKYGERISDE